MDCRRPTWYLRNSESKSYLMIFPLSLPILRVLLSLLEYFLRFSLLSIDAINLGVIVRFIFHSLDSLRSSIVSRKRSLAFSMYSLNDDLLLTLVFYLQRHP